MADWKHFTATKIRVNTKERLWKTTFDRSTDEQPKFASTVNEIHNAFQAIQPRDPGSSLAQALLPSLPQRNPGLSNWYLLKASTLFVTAASYSKEYVPQRVYWLTGKQLRYLKTDASQSGVLYPVSANMWPFLKTDGSLIRKIESGSVLEDSINLMELADETDINMGSFGNTS
ncbi:hypothetical protein BKA65DRAFT_558917 [Rhexocercosporidium sp. MPI-PUGE-AT-0058]|nr:hypothetical protein BKA65DRAFT_558917 [Rhexocercosporidium sp. MPI-PUGE-AT-0058]